MPGRLRIQYRIALPFALVAIVTTSIAAFVALSSVSRTLESEAIAQTQNAAAVLAQGDFALNEAILRSARQISGAEIITYTAGGEILATTVDARRSPSLVAMVAIPDAAREALAKTDDSAVVRRMACDTPCLVAYQRVATRPDTVVAVVAETSGLSAATRAITRTFVLATALSLFLMILVSQVVARRVAAPLDALVTFTRSDFTVGPTRRAPVGDDEVGRLAAAFNEMLDRLEGSRDALVRSEKLALAGLMAARVAHDIRNPLSSMKMQAQLLGACLGTDASTRANVDAILHDIQQVEGVVRDLIELARPGELKRRPTSLNEVIRDVLRQLSPQLTYRKIVVDTALDDRLAAVDLDVDRFRQVLLNVLGNAADAMPTGGTLRIASQSGDDGSMIVLDVTDDGVGIDPAIRDRVFDPFVSTKRDGVGLGLVNAKAVVESHGGTVELTAALPKGTRARIRLPVSAQTQGTGSRPTEQVHG